ncbi:synergin gamma [Halyomorpha halys]|uniref:synergin gamma n=1 Tax=Halyomorpha halys TaxID=286706 RepID=UPI0006D524BA|nr:synergin gamma-like [Halyomorpha halys]
MCAYKDNSNLDHLKKREYLKQQHQLRTMTKTTNVLSADDMIESLLSKKEIFKMKKETTNSSKNKTNQTTVPSFFIPGYEPPIYKHVWDIVGTPTGYADTPKLTNILLTSRLTTDVLGYIWSLSNSNLGPALLQHDTYTALALVALAQSGFGFTSSAVLNNLKEAPIPKLDFNELPIMKPPAIMAVTDVSTSTTMCSLPPIVSTACPPLNLPQSPNLLNPVVSTVTAEFDSKSTTPIAPPPNLIPTVPNMAINSLADNISLLDLDMPSTDAAPKTYLPSISTPTLIFNENNSLISDNNSLVDNLPHNTTSYELGNSLVQTKSFNVSNDHIDNSKTKDVEETPATPLSDDLFGDFQSVEFSLGKNEGKDDIEFDDFKSADFTTLNLLEVKEKPPEIKATLSVEPEPYTQEKTAGIEDLFPKCIVKPKEDGIDLLVEEEDKYSALRGLTSGDEFDEFGDFLTAAPVQSSTRLAPLVEYQNNIQERAMEACLDILEEAKKIFLSIEEVEVLNEVMSDRRGVQYLEELIEVERIAQRLQVALNKDEFSTKLEELSSALLRYLEPHKNSYMKEESGPKCGICLSEKGPAYVKYGINNFHAPCANLYLHKVDSSLPIAPVM